MCVAMVQSQHWAGLLFSSVKAAGARLAGLGPKFPAGHRPQCGLFWAQWVGRDIIMSIKLIDGKTQAEGI